MDKRHTFIRALAKFLAGDQAKKSIMLGMPNSVAFSLAQEWATLRSASPLAGYGTVEEAEDQLREWLLGEPGGPK